MQWKDADMSLLSDLKYRLMHYWFYKKLINKHVTVTYENKDNIIIGMLMDHHDIVIGLKTNYNPLFIKYDLSSTFSTCVHLHPELILSLKSLSVADDIILKLEKEIVNDNLF